VSGISLLAGPDRNGPERFSDHMARLGPLPPDAPSLIDVLDRSGLRGCGGAAFPVAAKWRAVAAQHSGERVIVVNGAEGEPLSRKDRLLMQVRPHLVLDGAMLAAETLRAERVFLYLGAEHTGAVRAMTGALQERSETDRRRTRLVTAPVGYVSGEESAAVHFINDGVALPTTTPPRPYQRGVGGRPTLIQNVETLAHVAMIARFGADWFRQLGRSGSTGTALLTVSGAVAAQTVIEVPQGVTLAEVVDAVGGTSARASAVLLGGYFGGWIAAEQAWDLHVDAASLKTGGHTLGCGVLAVLAASRCGVIESSRILTYLGDQSARQCGPCVFGLRAIADAVHSVAARRADANDIARVRRWAGVLGGRGACHHPDGAFGLLHSALRVFAAEFSAHLERGRCTLDARAAAA